MKQNVITHWNITRVPASELMARREKVIQEMAQHSCEAMLFFTAKALQYLAGANFIDTERPLVMILRADGRCAMLVPQLEEEHVPQATIGVDEIYVYSEFPGPKHPMVHLAEILAQMKLDKTNVAADGDGYGAIFGYTGPKISSLCPDMTLHLMPRLLEKLKIKKSAYDISVIKEDARWANFAHALLQEYTRPGLKELDVVSRVTAEATSVMLKTLGPDFVPGGDVQASADYRGQIGKNTYFPHALTNNATFRVGDLLGTRARAHIMGYNSELERCMYIGEPTKEIEFYFQHMLALQEVAFEMIRPGIKCSDVDKEVMRYYEENNLMPYWRHHVGHGLGLGKHEQPFFDCYDDTVIEQGMVFSVEPGLYVKGLGGFRHSDTVHVTADGIEMITYYPRKLEQLSIL